MDLQGVIKKTKRKKVLVLLGPTGSGKTEALSCLDGEKYEIVSCDSQQVYQGLEIATACPKAGVKKRLPHHLLSICSPKERFTAGQFVSLAKKAIEDIHKRGKRAVLSGGAGFYFRSLKSGMFPVQTPPEIRQKVEAMSLQERLQLLRKLDPEALISIDKRERVSQGRIHPNDQYRVLRALEIILASKGKKWSVFWQEARKKVSSTEYDFLGFYLKPAPLEHKQALLQRAKKMLRDGVIEEVGKVYEKYGFVPSLRALGCKEALKVYLGQASQRELPESLALAHYRYSKKQRLWLQKEKLSPIRPRDFAREWEKLLDGF